MAFKKDRVFAGFGAGLFLLTSSALTIAVILTLTSSSSSNNNTLVSATKSSKATSTTDAVGTKLQGFTPLTTPLKTIEIANLQTGTGTVVKSGATVTAGYIGALADSGIIFDTSQAHGGPQTFPLGNVIEGWQLGIPGMKVGGTRELLIPAALAYGKQGSGSIPPNSDLVFIVTIDKVTNP